MPIEFGVWRIDDGLTRVPISSLEDEEKLESILANDIGVLGLDIMLIGRQVPTAFGKRIDLLAINADGNLLVIELKRDRTPRDVIAQALDYGSWIKGLTYDDITAIFSAFDSNKKFEQAFAEHFDVPPPDSLNETHELIIVASELDSSTERIVAYLSGQYGVPVNAVFFRHFQDGKHQYLVRAWLIPPDAPEQVAPKKPGKQEAWNGQDFYVSLGEGPNRNWDDCVKYGFISGGGGKWYSQTLKNLFVGARVFANIPRTGYVGVGMVEELSQPVKDFRVNVDGKDLPILDVPLAASQMGKNADDLELSEYLVRIKWLKTLPRDKAIWESGMFAKQHTACKLRNRFTIDRLVELFGLTE